MLMRTQQNSPQCHNFKLCDKVNQFASTAKNGHENRETATVHV